ncbi:hypothetical protein [Winogradskyella sp.]|uniref:hypothetical protein n=1 Tax=Winogradskyella sp. TaxID=1883156 RepID=UPI0025D0C0B4|nr:hypothetical protein [Winogradskyella sp.]
MNALSNTGFNIEVFNMGSSFVGEWYIIVFVYNRLRVYAPNLVNTKQIENPLGFS